MIIIELIMIIIGQKVDYLDIFDYYAMATAIIILYIGLNNNQEFKNNNQEFQI